MQAKVTSRVTIAGSPEQVFTHLTNLSYLHLWSPHLRHVSHKGVIKKNSQYETTTQILGMTIKAANTVTRYRQNKELQIENMTGLLKYVVHYSLVADAIDTTILTCVTTVSSDSQSFAFKAPLLKILAKRELQIDLQALKTAIELQ